MKGFINDACQVNYPKEWLSIKKNENVAVWRNVHVIPNSSSDKGAEMSQHSIIYNGVYPHLGWFGKNYIPNYWRSLGSKISRRLSPKRLYPKTVISMAKPG